MLKDITFDLTEEELLISQSGVYDPNKIIVINRSDLTVQKMIWKDNALNFSKLLKVGIKIIEEANEGIEVLE